MYPDCDTLSNVPRSGYITARDQNKVESGVTDGGIASFLFRGKTRSLGKPVSFVFPRVLILIENLTLFY